jgi:phosphate transport system permease protein
MIPDEKISVDKEETNRESSSFTKESLKKQFRPSEYIAEKAITLVAFFSIAIIILIFVFVFREAAPIFISQENTSANNKSSESVIPNQSNSVNQSIAPVSSSEKNNESDIKPENESNNKLKPETYGDDELKPEKYDDSEIKPEKYGEDELKPERYGEETKTVKPVKTNVPEAGKKINKKVSEKEPLENPEKTLLTNVTDQPVARVSERRSTLAEESNASNKAALQTLTGKEWQPVSDNPRYGLLPLFAGTFKLTLIAILFAAPIGILAAIFTSCFAPKWLREIIKPVVELLSGFPSVVIGFFALMVMATFFQDLFGYGSRLNSFVGGIAMALAAIPIIYTISEDALTSVPSSYKEASIALGASRWQTAFFVVLPAATPGIFAAILLGVGRVFGETMIALMATGNAALITANPFDSVRALSATIGAEMAEVVFGDTHYNVLFLIGSLLFIFTFLLNMFAEFYIKGKLVKRFQGQKS